MELIKFVEQISYRRMGGSPEEEKTAKLIAEYLKKFGYEPTIEPFPIMSYVPGEGELTPTEPEGEPIPVNPVGLSADADVEGELVILDVPEPEWIDRNMVEGKIVIMPHPPRWKWLEALVKNGAKAALVVVDDIRIRGYLTLSQKVAKNFGDKIPVATIGYKYAINLVNSGVKRAHLKTHHEKFDAYSRNVYAELPGETDRMIILTAHYDSTPCSPGAEDNAAGTAELLELAQRLAGKKFRRTIRFVFCGAEEMGLLGSKAHSELHSDQLEKLDFVINLDVGGNPFVPILIRILGTDDLEHFIAGLMRQKGFGTTIRQDIYSSDGMPFSRFGVPSLSVARFGISGRGHSPYDEPWRLNENALRQIVDVAEAILLAVADAKLLPFPREISEANRKKIEDYFNIRR